MSNMRIAFVDCLPDLALADQTSAARFGTTFLDRPRPDTFERYLHDLEHDSELAVLFVGGGSSAPEPVRKLRSKREFAKTRVYVVRADAEAPVPGWSEALDVEDSVAPATFTRDGLTDMVELGLRAYHSLTLDPLYDVTRPARTHLAFGHGTHFCPAASLGRLEAQIDFETLLRRLPSVELAVPASQVIYVPSNMLRSLQSLPVRFPTAAGAAPAGR